MKALNDIVSLLLLLFPTCSSHMMPKTAQNSRPILYPTNTELSSHHGHGHCQYVVVIAMVMMAMVIVMVILLLILLLLLLLQELGQHLFNMIIMTCYYCSWRCSYYKNYGSLFNMSLLTYYCC